MSQVQAHPAAFTVDLEDYYHPELIRRHATIEQRLDRAAISTEPILELLERHGVHATFFIVGEVIEKAPGLIRRIVRAGHEIGCHTHTHLPLWEMTPESFRDELRRFRSALTAAAGNVPVRGFRAPTFSVDGRTAWALRVLHEEGFTYDSSIVPIRGPLYGCAGAPFGIYRPALDRITADDPSSPMAEVPAPVASLAGKHIPVGGGFYLRALPFALYRRLVHQVLRRRPFFLYVHPWETDSRIPRFALPPLARWATYTGIAGVLSKLEALLQQIRFTTLRAVLEASGVKV